jgi:hypothetical protein
MLDLRRSPSLKEVNRKEGFYGEAILNVRKKTQNVSAAQV